VGQYSIGADTLAMGRHIFTDIFMGLSGLAAMMISLLVSAGE
jgi:hypothetical protein